MTHTQKTQKVTELRNKLSTMEEKIAQIEATEYTHKEWKSLNDLYDQEYDLEKEIKSTEVEYLQTQALKAGASGQTTNIR